MNRFAVLVVALVAACTSQLVSEVEQRAGSAIVPDAVIGFDAGSGSGSGSGTHDAAVHFDAGSGSGSGFFPDASLDGGGGSGSGSGSIDAGGGIIDAGGGIIDAGGGIIDAGNGSGSGSGFLLDAPDVDAAGSGSALPVDASLVDAPPASGGGALANQTSFYACASAGGTAGAIPLLAAIGLTFRRRRR